MPALRRAGSRPAPLGIRPRGRQSPVELAHQLERQRVAPLGAVHGEDERIVLAVGIDVWQEPGFGPGWGRRLPGMPAQNLGTNRERTNCTRRRVLCQQAAAASRADVNGRRRDRGRDPCVRAGRRPGDVRRALSPVSRSGVHRRRVRGIHRTSRRGANRPATRRACFGRFANLLGPRSRCGVGRSRGAPAFSQRQRPGNDAAVLVLLRARRRPGVRPVSRDRHSGRYVRRRRRRHRKSRRRRAAHGFTLHRFSSVSAGHSETRGIVWGLAHAPECRYRRLPAWTGTARRRAVSGSRSGSAPACDCPRADRRPVRPVRRRTREANASPACASISKATTLHTPAAFRIPSGAKWRFKFFASFDRARRTRCTGAAGSLPSSNAMRPPASRCCSCAFRRDRCIEAPQR